jgi:hypothetical protein
LNYENTNLRAGSRLLESQSTLDLARHVGSPGTQGGRLGVLLRTKRG